MRQRSSADGRRWPVDDRGAVAIFLSLMMVLVLLPLSALGLSTYVRGTLRSELQRAADSAALAGAASIPLGDLDFARAYALGLVGPTTLPELPGDPLGSPLGTGVDPLRNSCDQARRAASQPTSLGDAYAEPIAATGTSPATCGTGAATSLPRVDAAGFVSATYLPDTSLVSSLDDCVDTLLTTATSGLPSPPPTDPLPAPGVGVPNLEALGRTVPALLRPGVRVQTRWRTRGPLDQLLGSTTTTAMSGTALARRRIKNAVVLPVAQVQGRRISVQPEVIRRTDQAEQALRDAAAAAANPGSVYGQLPIDPISIVPDSATATVTVTTPVGTIGGTIVVDPPPVVPPPLPGAPRSCSVDVINALADDYEDLVDPQENPRDQEEIIREAACLRGSECRSEGGKPTPLLTLLVGPGPTLYDTVPVCFPPDADVVPSTSASARLEDGRLTVDYEIKGGVLTGARCAPAAPGAFRATLTRS